MLEKTVVLFVCLNVAVVYSCDKDQFAVCNMVSNPSRPFTNIAGTVVFYQSKNKMCNPTALVVAVNINNVPADADSTLSLHGFHVHENGTMTTGCEDMQGHYNPGGTVHGGPSNDSKKRHPGDFGNVRRQENGIISTIFRAKGAKLSGPHSIIGRGIVLHAGEDDLGQGGDAGSQASGNAGARLACCTIEAFP